MTIQEFIKETFDNKDNKFANFRPHIVCNDGFTMSVQASTGHYCSPRINTDIYNSVEIGYPSEKEDLILEYAEEQDRPTDTFYGYVPVNIIQEVIDKHNGIDVDKTFKN